MARFTSVRQDSSRRRTKNLDVVESEPDCFPAHRAFRYSSRVP